MAEFPTFPAILYDRSRVTTDWRCPHSRYLGYEWGGTGLAAETMALELYTGIVLHDGLSAIGQDFDIDKVANLAAGQMRTALFENSRAEGAAEADASIFAQEQAALTEGLLRGFHRIVWPRFQKQFPTIVAVEKELIFNHATTHPLIKSIWGSEKMLRFMSKPDLLVRDTEGGLWYVEYKSTASNKDAWTNSWSTAVQLHSSIRAVEQEYGEKVAGIIVQGLYKGYVNYGKQTSPFCYAYHRQGNPPFTKEAWSYAYAAGYKKFPVWEREGGVKAWVENMPEEQLAEQFPQVPPIFIKDDLVDDFFRQRALREAEIAIASQEINDPATLAERKQEIIDVTFPRRFDQCTPSFGKACQFARLCHGPQGIDPLALGFTRRTPHHDPEVELWKQKGLITDEV